MGIDHADDADGAQGNMTAFSAAARVALVSDGADTRTVTIVGEVGGVRTVEAVVLNGASEVLSVATFDITRGVYLCYVSALDAARTVTIKQGSGGATRGTIGPNKKVSFLWFSGPIVDTKAEGLKHGDIAAGANFMLWFRLVWAAGAGAVSATSENVRSEGDTEA